MAPVCKVRRDFWIGACVSHHCVNHDRTTFRVGASVFEIGSIECNNLRQHSENVDGLEADEGEEPRMILSANATIDPGAVMIVALNASLTYVAVIASG